MAIKEVLGKIKVRDEKSGLLLNNLFQDIEVENRKSVKRKIVERF